MSLARLLYVMAKRSRTWSVDTDTLNRAGAGDEEAFRRVVERYYRPALSIAAAVVNDTHDAQDIAQDAFIRMRPALCDLVRSGSFYTWLRRIIRNASIDDLRRKRANRASNVTPFGGAPEISSSATDPETRAIEQDEVVRVTAAIDRLGPELRSVVILRAVEDLSYADIAERLGIPIGTVMSRLHAARERLRALLDE